MIIVLKQSKRRFPEKVDFVTCPGYLDGKPGRREEYGLLANTGPSIVITDMGLYRFEDREMTLNAIHTDIGITMEEIRAGVGWDLKISSDLRKTEPPTAEELSMLREKVDPNKMFVDGKFAVQE